MLVIGLTGGIGSGKTTVANLFAKRGVPIIDADIIAREITSNKTTAFSDILSHFKNDLLLSSDGELNRAKLRSIIFQNPQERKWLENLLHPQIQAEIKSRLLLTQSPYTIVVIPLLIEVQPYPFIDKILVIDALISLQIERVAVRDHLSPSAVEAIIKTQVSREERLKKCDDVIINDGKLSHLESQVNILHQKYLDLSQAIGN